MLLYHCLYLFYLLLLMINAQYFDNIHLNVFSILPICFLGIDVVVYSILVVFCYLVNPIYLLSYLFYAPLFYDNHNNIIIIYYYMMVKYILPIMISKSVTTTEFNPIGVTCTHLMKIASEIVMIVQLPKHIYSIFCVMYHSYRLYKDVSLFLLPMSEAVTVMMQNLLSSNNINFPIDNNNNDDDEDW